MNESLFLFSIVAAFAALSMNVVRIRKLKNDQLQFILAMLLIFSMTRYVTLFIYREMPTLILLQTMRYFYFASSLGLTMTMALAIWYVVPCYREKISVIKYLFVFLPWFVFYSYLLIKQPTEIIRGEKLGYVLVLTEKWPFYLSIAQGSLLIILCTLSVYGILRYKHLQIRVQLLFMIASGLLLAVDGISYGSDQLFLFPPFTVTEAFGFMGTSYCFAHAVKTIGKGRMA